MRAIKESCDVFFYTVGQRLGLDPLHDIASQLGFGEKPGLGLVNETAGVLPNAEWHKQTHHRGWFASTEEYLRVWNAGSVGARQGRGEAYVRKAKRLKLL